ncbi:hypothetical protein [Candidatus Harpocratesius sp.]
MSEFTTSLKNFGKAVGIYILLNFVFIILFPLFNGIPIGYFLTGMVGKDITGFVVALLIPGGGLHSGYIFSSTSYYLGDLINYWGTRENSIIWDILGFLWVWLPGLLSAIFMGKIFCQERPSKSFWSEFWAIFVLTILPLIIIFAIEINGIYELTQNIIPLWLRTHTEAGISINWIPTMYLNVILIGLFNGLFFGGLASISSTEL